ncbi:MAG: histidine phosphatase family protein [Pseudomonadota bacterium]
MLRYGLAFLFLCLPSIAAAQAAVLERLGEPRTHAIMRHALAPGTGDPENFSLGDCTTQRNLSENGRAQARRAGDLVRRAGVRIDHVWSSAWCRCLDTATEMELGPVERKTLLNSFVSARWKAAQRTRETREALAFLPPDETAFLVTHNVNAEALTGTRPLSGEIQVVHVSERGEVTLLGSVEVPAF